MAQKKIHELDLFDFTSFLWPGLFLIFWTTVQTPTSIYQMPKSTYLNLKSTFQNPKSTFQTPTSLYQTPKSTYQNLKSTFQTTFQQTPKSTFQSPAISIIKNNPTTSLLSQGGYQELDRLEQIKLLLKANRNRPLIR